MVHFFSGGRLAAVTETRVEYRGLENKMTYTLEQVRGLTVADVMRSQVLAAEADWSLETLADFLVDNSISGAPVITKNDELVGVVSLTDIVRERSMGDGQGGRGNTHDVYLYELERHMNKEELRVFHAQEESPVRVRDIMTPMIFQTGKDASLQDVAETMIKGRIHRVFVTEGGRLAGIVTTLDMLQVIRDL